MDMDMEPNSTTSINHSILFAYHLQTRYKLLNISPVQAHPHQVFVTDVGRRLWRQKDKEKGNREYQQIQKMFCPKLLREQQFKYFLI
jgi:hypothetical protein